MKKGYVGLLACASGILIGLGISRLDLTGYLEKTQEQGYHPVERKVPESVESKLKDPKQCWLCGSDERSMMDYFRKFDDLGVLCTKCGEWKEKNDKGYFSVTKAAVSLIYVIK